MLSIIGKKLDVKMYKMWLYVVLNKTSTEMNVGVFCVIMDEDRLKIKRITIK